MKKIILVSTSLLLIGIFILFNAFTKSGEIAKNNTEQCFDWQRSPSGNIQFRWCKDPELKTTSYQFFNGYNFKIWYYFKISYTNGETSTGNTILDGGEYSDKGAMYNRTPSFWNITKKQRKNDNGLWEDF